jgi:site-specific recombinase XerD
MIMSGGTTRELANVTVDDVDLAGGRFWVHGGGYKCRDRWVPFTDEWCRQAIEQRVAELRATYEGAAGDVWLVYKPHPTQPTPTRQAEAASSMITRLLQKARLHQPGKTRAESIREWLALKVFEETGSIEQVAVRLGCASLDAAAHLVGYDWVAPSSQDPAPLHRQGDDA